MRKWLRSNQPDGLERNAPKSAATGGKRVQLIADREYHAAQKGSSQSAVSSNIKTLVDDWNKDGSIGASHPPTKKKAIKQDVAIALAKADKSRNTQPRRRKAS